MGLNSKNIRSYSLEVIGNIKPIIKDLRQIAKNYPEAIVEVEYENSFIRFNDKIPHSAFYFFISPPITENAQFIPGNNHFTVFLHPASEIHDQQKRLLLEKSHIVELFKSWISLVLTYRAEELSISPEDAIQKKYEEEFLTEFVILEEDADEAPFSFEKQIKIYKFLEIVETEIESIKNKSKAEIEVLKEAKELKEKIPSLTKNQAASALAKFYGHVKKLGISFLKKVANKIVDKAIEWTLSGRGQQLIDTIHQHFL